MNATPKAHRKGRNSEAELERRCSDIYGLVVDGLPFRAIRQYVAESCAWSVNEYTLRRYIKRCTKRFSEEAKVDREAVKGQAIARLERLYSRAVQKGHIRDALAVQQEISRLHGLNAADKHELAGPGGVPLPGMTTEELAARFEELLRTQRRRLKDKPPRS